MNLTRDGGPAFPRSVGVGSPFGMSLREWFAGQAPPLPQPIVAAIERHLKTEEPDLPLWNDFALDFYAHQEARWRQAFTNEMIDAFVLEINAFVPEKE